MKKHVGFAVAAGIAVGVALVAFGAYAAEELKVGTTLENLNAAFNGESNAHARYLAFAKKADEEGYQGAASLFRAAARAEEIHANNHKKVIEGMGGTAKATLEEPAVKSTAENLKAAIAGESYERDVMYPGFLSKARTDRNREAFETFNFAKSAEAEHAKLYQAALDNLDQSKDPTTYYVCTVCGYTTPKLDFKTCPLCFSPVDVYEKVQ